MYYIIYSEQATKEYGYNIYIDNNGEEVKGTAVTDNLEWYQKEYCWPDKKIVGRTTDC